ncbi:hypothetical protein JSR02_00625 [Candidatus Vidania fulgoroideae]|uniref:tRNA-specific 2-thiouridylase MnmA n=1 Tax=Candidatus Vidania fulgoroideorum TaxID=881286 RepID=A0A974X9C9_9PROT|nr:hypothetical protein JSR02_00625 [Candidatus Vidania fulgoroideae]
MVVVLYSGGLDSTFVAFLLKKLNVGFYCVYIKVCLTTSTVWFSEYCKCELLAATLCCSLLFVDLSKYYCSYVFSRFRYCYARGLTPNPDIFCNSKLKFSCFVNYCLQYFGVPVYYFSGHYACKRTQSLAIARDWVKDQTYFLCAVFCFCNLFFLLGNFFKYEVRFFIIFLCLLACVNATSRGVCFLGINNFASFVARYCTRRYIIYNTIGKFLGYARAGYLTVGQRFTYCGLKDTYVVRKCPVTITVAKRNSNRTLTYHVSVLLRSLLGTIVFPKVYYCKVNSCSWFFKCFVWCVSLPYFVHFVYPVRVLAKGQFLVIYDAGLIIAGMEII